ncbi:hypothetical protein BGM19_38500 [Streptomyces agglomeratus]|uniref:Uncharacterized protein n=2 Tax=Streptomyces agglomeratus TaxID=285458 RepID=A0A1E5NZ30_9ACTN|nr:hypothetical protein AS594_38340 [Streptomyces agglomeratus]OEJ36433.1 hypothetical protein BGK72_37570 [Streptomyces agglomeratus]OEJ56547.1 hypothetical protein BGM19_38500 [Streptomyces agglomeratus]
MHVAVDSHTMPHRAYAERLIRHCDNCAAREPRLITVYPHRMVLSRAHTFPAAGGALLAGPTVGFLCEQTAVTRCAEAEVDTLTVLRFFGRYDSKAVLKAARWCKDHVDGHDIEVTSAWFRHIDEEVEDGLNYEIRFVVETI